MNGSKWMIKESLEKNAQCSFLWGGEPVRLTNHMVEKVGHYSIYVSSSKINDGVVGLGGLLMDAGNNNVMSWCSSRDFILSLVGATLLAVRLALVKVVHFKWANISIHLDAKEIVHKLSNKSIFGVANMTIAEDIFLMNILIVLEPFCDAGIVYGESACGAASAYLSKILIKGGTVVNAHHQEVADVYIEDGIIVAVQNDIMVGDDVRIIDATGKYVMPGGIDPHTHLAMEFMGTETIDDFFSGQAAALAGGTTMHIDFVIPANGSLSAGYEAYVKKAEKSAMDYGFHMAITKWDETVSREMEVMVKDKGINSFKFFLAYKGSLMINDDLLLEGFKKCKSLGALAMVHAENGDAVFEGQKRMIELGITGPEGHALSRPPVLEGEATGRAIRLAGFVNTPLYVVHVMSIDAMEEIAKARKSGQKVIGEPVVSGLVLDDSALWDPDFQTAAKFVMSPPIRAPGHGKALQAALSTGILQLVGTDHCTFNSTQKALGIGDFRKIPNGVNGLEERMHLVWDTMVVSGQISVTDFVRVTSTEWFRKIMYFVLQGKVEVTISGGKVVWENDELKAVPSSGKYIEMPPYNYLFDGIGKTDAEYLSSLRAPVKRAVHTV
ncbi:hypothetical protein DH2020_046441 [Rehmannia glutinosa]|uniref:dihydropyrimidinase n=1 Tax=Rehmannia glutinosa TaxID=99300 RepID=A0ABR0UCZ8_REHGL